MFEYFLKHLSGNKVLDIWCAFGRDISRMRENWYKAYGLEISENLIALADENIKSYILQGDITDLRKYYENESFDGIFSAASIVHMDIKTGKRVLKNSYNILRKNWLLFLSIKTTNQTSYTISKESISLPGIQKQYSYYNSQEMKEYFENLWFQILKSHVWKPWNDEWTIYICKK